ncbi:hypothetical protein VPH35_086640 [Triticum aestivum]
MERNMQLLVIAQISPCLLIVCRRMQLCSLPSIILSRKRKNVASPGLVLSSFWLVNDLCTIVHVLFRHVTFMYSECINLSSLKSQCLPLSISNYYIFIEINSIRS